MTWFEERDRIATWLLVGAGVSFTLALGLPEHTAYERIEVPDSKSGFLFRQPDASEPPEVEGWDAAKVFAHIDKEFGRLSEGSAVFNVPNEMRVAEPERVVARIARLGEEQDILRDLPPGVAKQWKQAHITPTMRARLNGAVADFKIDGEAPEEQFVGGGNFTQWAWVVTPLASGEKELTLNISAVVTVAGYEKPRDVLVRTRRVHVRVNPKRWVNNFVEENWGKGLAFVLGGSIVSLWRGFRAKIQTFRKRDTKAGFK
jgi:hypothetical protein